MDEQTQAQFLQWLAGTLGVSTEEELQDALANVDDNQMQQLFAQFQQESQAQAFKKGGQINYLKKLKAFKKGGSASIKEGNASTKKVHTAVGGAKPAGKKDIKKSDRKETSKLKLNSLVNKNKL